jgi:hypothetical protein
MSHRLATNSQPAQTVIAEQDGQVRRTSRRVTVVVLQQPTQPFPTLDLAGNQSNSIAWFNELIVDSLVISLSMIIPRNTTPTLR